MYKNYDFSGWATKNDLTCEDGLVIKKNAFATNDGKKVPLVYNHDHNDVTSIIGHAYLENRDNGVYAYCYLNDTEKGRHAKDAIKHNDVDSLSIWANNLQKNGRDVVHGNIRELSLVLAGANPGAMVESVMAHGCTIADDDDEGIIYTGDNILLPGGGIEHASKDEEEEDVAKESGGKTIGEVFETLNDDQRLAVAAVIEQALKDGGNNNDDTDEDEEDDEDEEEETVKHNIFSDGDNNVTVLSHSDMQNIFADAKRMGSLKAAVEENIDGGVLAHSIDTSGMVGPSSSTARQTYGFRDPDMLFPDYKSLNNPPEWIGRNTDWVQVLMGAVSHTPFSRIKSVYADITEDDARARGYIKGKQKKDEVFTLLKRTTDPQTIYKRQKMDRDDIIDITDFDVVAWIRAEMRVMLDEEIARAVLIGDGRVSSSDDKIQESHVRPIVNDVPLFNIKYAVTTAASATEDDQAKAIIRSAIKARKDYKGSGNPIFFTTEDVLTNLLLLEDNIGHKLYKTEQELATAMRVSRIVTVEVMEGAKVPVTSGESTTNKDLIGVIVNPKDYNIGADKGGAINMFDDFDIDYNQQKYLIETRISGALVKPYSAITLYADTES